MRAVFLGGRVPSVVSELYPKANLVAFFSVFAPSPPARRRARRRFANKNTGKCRACPQRNILQLLRGALPEPKKPPKFGGVVSRGYA